VKQVIRSASLLIGLLVLQVANGQELQSSPQSPLNKDPSKLQVLLNAKLEDLTPVAAGPVSVSEGYASVRYAIGTTLDRPNIKAWLDYIGHTLPAKFGNTSGTYIITITVYDQTGKQLLAKEPIVSFQWSVERGFLFIDKVVDDVQKTSWRGTLVSDLRTKEPTRFTPDTRRLRVGVEVYVQKDRSLDFDLLKKTAQTFSSNSLAALLPPLPAAVVPMIDSIGQVLNAFYSNSIKATLVDEDELDLQTVKRYNAPVTFSDPDGKNPFTLPIFITVDTRPSRLIDGPLKNGKFAQDSLSETIFANMGIPLADKTVSVVELISTSTEPTFKGTRSVLDTLVSGGTYGKDPANKKENDIGAQCGNLYDALNAYLSAYDARAMFWAFVTRYKDQMNVDACLGSRKAELAAVGLGF
jgi:hypothetical protein